MKIKLLLILLLTAAFPALAQKAALSGTVVEADTGNPVAGALVMLQEQGLTVTTGPAGDFLFTNAAPGQVTLITMTPGYSDGYAACEIFNNQTVTIPAIVVKSDDASAQFHEDNVDMWLDESVLDDETGNSQSIISLSGSSDDIYYRTASYNFGPMYFNYRGYDSRYQDVYINGIKFNDLIRGRFNFSMLGGMTSRAFRNRTTNVGLDAASYGFGSIGGASNYNTVTSSYAAGFNGSVAYTNSNYMLRAMATYSTGISEDGWGVTVSAIGRYAPEGVIEGTFYNSLGAFVSIEKVFNKKNSLTLTAFAAPIQRAAASATYQEAYDLAGTNLYNPKWGYQDGKKRSSSIREQFDPTAILNYIYKDKKVTVNTAAALRWSHYSTSAFNYYNANNPNPDYYKYLPSYWKSNEEMFDLMTEQWRNNVGTRQVDWGSLYQANYYNNFLNEGKPDDEKAGASYILENRVTNQLNAMFNSYINYRLNERMSLQGGVSLNYTKASFYKTVRDLLGADFWIDIDPYSDQISTLEPNVLQNDLDYYYEHGRAPRVKDGDKFGYDYDINAIQAQAWLQNMINLPQWDINYGLSMTYTQYQRNGYMRNGRAPHNSLGKSAVARFDDAMLKAGATYKLDGRNFFSGHLMVGTMAPIADNIFVAPRVKNDIALNTTSENIFSGDLSYAWNYRRFRGSVTGFYTVVNNAMEHTLFYDDNHSTNANFTLSGVKRCYKGVEVGMAYKITPSLTATFAGTYSRIQYKNNPKGTRSFENGMYADTTQTVYLKNYYMGSTPQTVFNLGIDWAAPKMWFFNINGTWQGDSYVNLGIPYHEAFPNLWQQPDIAGDRDKLIAKMEQLTHQEKLRNAFSLNISIGKLVYINRKVSMNFNLNVNNVLNNRNVVTYAYQQSRIDTKNYDPSYYANRYTYAQGTRVFLNVGIKF